MYTFYRSGRKRSSFRAGSKENIDKVTPIPDVASEESADLSTSLDQTGLFFLPHSESSFCHCFLKELRNHIGKLFLCPPQK